MIEHEYKGDKKKTEGRVDQVWIFARADNSFP